MVGMVCVLFFSLQHPMLPKHAWSTALFVFHGLFTVSVAVTQTTRPASVMYRDMPPEAQPIHTAAVLVPVDVPPFVCFRHR